MARTASACRRAGHPYPENARERIRTDRDGVDRVYRECRACAAEKERDRQAVERRPELAPWRAVREELTGLLRVLERTGLTVRQITDRTDR